MIKSYISERQVRITTEKDRDTKMEKETTTSEGDNNTENENDMPRKRARKWIYICSRSLVHFYIATQYMKIDKNFLDTQYLNSRHSQYV